MAETHGRSPAVHLSRASSRWDILSDAAGRPIIPIGSIADERAVVRVCRSLSIDPKWIVGRGGKSGASRRGGVVALGKQWKCAAALYAHLTSRTWQCVCSWEQIDIGSLEVLFLSPQDLSEARLDTVYAKRPGGRTAPGIFICTDEDSAFSQVVAGSTSLNERKAALAAILPNRPQTPVIDTDSLFVAPDWSAYLGSRLRSSRGRLGAMVVETHSDGVDARLGQFHVLCSQIGAVHNGAPAPMDPRCVETGFCHRLQQEFATDLLAPQLVKPMELEASIVFWGSCFGVVLPSDPAHEFRSSILHRLQSTATLGAFITTTGPAYIRSRLVNFSVNLIRHGVPAGRIVSMLNASRSAHAAALRFVLVGEPGVRLAQGAKGRLVPPRRLQPLQPASPLQPDAGELAFAISCVRELETKCTNHLSRSCAGPSPPAHPTNVEAIVERLCDLYGSAGAVLVDSWLPGWTPADEKLEPARCWMCAGLAPLKSVVFRWTQDPRVARIVSFCEVCGICEDRPKEWEGPRVAFDGSNLTLYAPERATGARVCLRSKLAQESSVFDWPTSNWGHPLPSFAIPALGFRGPLELGILVRDGHAVAVFSRRLRQVTGNE